MAAHHSILPFPADIDRRDFGNWLSGLTDGESCFYLGFNKNHGWRQSPFADWHIGLRIDDMPALELVRSYLGCGRIYSYPRNKKASAKAHDVARLKVTDAANLIQIIVPHFERFPLRAKKARDFAVWRKAVELIYGHKIRSRGGNGSILKWSPESIAEYKRLVAALQIRHTLGDFTPPVPLPKSPRQCSLFDSLPDPS